MTRGTVHHGDRGVLTLGLDDVPRWTQLRKKWLNEFLSVYGPMDECFYHYPRPWLEHEDIAGSMKEKDQIFLGISGDQGSLMAGMRVKKRGADLLLEGFSPRVLSIHQRKGPGRALLAWCLQELREGRARRVVSKLHGREEEIKPYIKFYLSNGFHFDHGHPRLEMVADLHHMPPLKKRPVEMIPAQDLGTQKFAEIYRESYAESTARGLSHERQDKGRTSVEDYAEELSEMRKSFVIDPIGNWYAAYAKHRYVGVILCGLRKDGMTVDVQELAVAPEERGKGIGTYMLGWSLRRLRNLGVKMAGLGVDDGNQAARRVYEKVGFQAVHTTACLLKGHPPHL